MDTDEIARLCDALSINEDGSTAQTLDVNLKNLGPDGSNGNSLELLGGRGSCKNFYKDSVGRLLKFSDKAQEIKASAINNNFNVVPSKTRSEVTVNLDHDQKVWVDRGGLETKKGSWTVVMIWGFCRKSLNQIDESQPDGKRIKVERSKTLNATLTLSENNLTNGNVVAKTQNLDKAMEIDTEVQTNGVSGIEAVLKTILDSIRTSVDGGK
ncbi:hypothetical protein LWI28_015086 [Acer negundo]|uniref:Uncharacterized protein n=1 Tax=Acer negundo TaxID=4023 RepID=A0AAD5JBS5_ACENE|nr:hypothetical protein LWI28_015086 [Acer negundo]